MMMMFKPRHWQLVNSISIPFHFSCQLCPTNSKPNCLNYNATTQYNSIILLQTVIVHVMPNMSPLNTFAICLIANLLSANSVVGSVDSLTN